MSGCCVPPLDNGNKVAGLYAVFVCFFQDVESDKFWYCAQKFHKHCKYVSRPCVEIYLAILDALHPPDFPVDKFASCVPNSRRLHMNAKTDSVLGDCVDWRPRDLLLDTFSHYGRLDHKKHTHARLSPRSHFHCSIYDAIVCWKLLIIGDVVSTVV